MEETVANTKRTIELWTGMLTVDGRDLAVSRAESCPASERRRKRHAETKERAQPRADDLIGDIPHWRALVLRFGGAGEDIGCRATATGGDGDSV